MGTTLAELAELQQLDPSEWADYLAERSGLPGPRANLPLVQAVAELADQRVIDHLLRDGGEYPVMCAAAAAGRRSEDAESESLARALATDERWRVREGVVIGLQLLGDRDLAALRTIVLDWVDDVDPLVQRAAIAAICEPRLLSSPETAALALDACRRATAHLAALAPEARRRPAARTLRQSLGYCWSVAVAADVDAGVPVFLGLDDADPDITWIVRENRRKKRLAAVL
ncbi:HEAT repeat domain-containing protein [Plantibacter flavus]|uniref:HEAT repeat domain-containing protein n=1 Tax=Plantibacter flavus TaxID=150123 RepID=UPI003F15A64F